MKEESDEELLDALMEDLEGDDGTYTIDDTARTTIRRRDIIDATQRASTQARFYSIPKEL